MTARALLIGINHYYGIVPLHGAKGDAADIKEWLVSQGVDPIEELVSPGGQDMYTATPKASDVDDWLDRLGAEAASVKRQNGDIDVLFPLGDRLYVFFAGHGYNSNTAGPTGVFPRTTTENWNVVPFGPLLTTLKHLAYFKEIVFIVDACREVNLYALDPIWNRKPKPRVGHTEVKKMLIQAAESGEKTREIDFGDKNSSEKIRGVLSQAFLAGVTGLAAENGQVTAEKLKGHIIAAVKSKIPEADPDIDANDSIVICQVDAVNVRIEITCAQAVTGAVLRRNTRGENVIDLEQGANSFDVPPGAYTLELPGREPFAIHAVWKVNHVNT